MAGKQGAAVIAARKALDSRGIQAPPGRKPVPATEQTRRMSQLAGHVAAGNLPLDERTAPFVAEAMKRRWHHARRRP